MFVNILNKKLNGGRPRCRPIPVICPLDKMMLFSTHRSCDVYNVTIHNLCVTSYFVAAFNNLCFTFYYHRSAGDMRRVITHTRHHTPKQR